MEGKLDTDLQQQPFPGGTVPKPDSGAGSTQAGLRLIDAEDEVLLGTSPPNVGKSQEPSAAQRAKSLPPRMFSFPEGTRYLKPQVPPAVEDSFFHLAREILNNYCSKNLSGEAFQGLRSYLEEKGRPIPQITVTTKQARFLVYYIPALQGGPFFMPTEEDQNHNITKYNLIERGVDILLSRCELNNIGTGYTGKVDATVVAVPTPPASTFTTTAVPVDGKITEAFNKFKSIKKQIDQLQIKRKAAQDIVTESIQTIDELEQTVQRICVELNVETLTLEEAGSNKIDEIQKQVKQAFKKAQDERTTVLNVRSRINDILRQADDVLVDLNDMVDETKISDENFFSQMGEFLTKATADLSIFLCDSEPRKEYSTFATKEEVAEAVKELKKQIHEGGKIFFESTNATQASAVSNLQKAEELDKKVKEKAKEIAGRLAQQKEREEGEKAEREKKRFEFKTTEKELMKQFLSYLNGEEPWTQLEEADRYEIFGQFSNKLLSLNKKNVFGNYCKLWRRERMDLRNTPDFFLFVKKCGAEKDTLKRRCKLAQLFFQCADRFCKTGELAFYAFVDIWYNHCVDYLITKGMGEKAFMFFDLLIYFLELTPEDCGSFIKKSFEEYPVHNVAWYVEQAEGFKTQPGYNEQVKNLLRHAYFWRGCLYHCYKNETEHAREDFNRMIPLMLVAEKQGFVACKEAILAFQASPDIPAQLLKDEPGGERRWFLR